MTLMTEMEPVAGQVIAEPSPFTSIALVLPDGMTFEEWSRIGGTLSTMENGLNWWIGDWLNYGERSYGEKYAQAIQETGRRRQTLANIASVAGRIPPERRRESLSWSAHAEVAGLSPDEQVQVLDEAEVKGWGTLEVRARVREVKNALPPAPEQAQHYTDVGIKSEPVPANNKTETAIPESDPAAELVMELEEADRTIRAQQAEIESLRSTDHGGEIAKLHERMTRMESRLHQVMQESREKERIIKAQRRTLESAAKLLGVSRFSEIVPALQDLIR